MPAGQMALTPSGLARFTSADLAAAGLREAATIEIDTDERTIWLRAPRRGETPRRITPPKGGACASIALGGALLAIGVNPADVSSRHAVAIDDGQLIVRF